jgi:hypothetical protein
MKRNHIEDIVTELEIFNEVAEPTKVQKVEIAQRLLLGCIDLLKDSDLGSNTEAYIIDKLEIYASNDHGFCSREKNLDDVIREVSEEEDEEICKNCGKIDHITNNCPY